MQHGVLSPCCAMLRCGALWVASHSDEIARAEVIRRQHGLSQLRPSLGNAGRIFPRALSAFSRNRPTGWFRPKSALNFGRALPRVDQVWSRLAKRVPSLTKVGRVVGGITRCNSGTTVQTSAYFPPPPNLHTFGISGIFRPRPMTLR